MAGRGRPRAVAIEPRFLKLSLDNWLTAVESRTEVDFFSSVNQELRKLGYSNAFVENTDTASRTLRRWIKSVQRIPSHTLAAVANTLGVEYGELHLNSSSPSFRRALVTSFERHAINCRPRSGSMPRLSLTYKYANEQAITLSCEEDFQTAFPTPTDSLGFLIGPPGSGKSWTMAQVGTSHIETYFDGEHCKLPLVVDLSNWRRIGSNHLNVLDWIFDVAVKGLSSRRDLKQSFVQFAQSGEILFIFENLDLVLPTRRVECLNALKRFTDWIAAGRPSTSTTDSYNYICCREREFRELATLAPSKRTVTQVLISDEQFNRFVNENVKFTIDNRLLPTAVGTGTRDEITAKLATEIFAVAESGARHKIDDAASNDARYSAIVACGFDSGDINSDEERTEILDVLQWIAAGRQSDRMLRGETSEAFCKEDVQPHWFTDSRHTGLANVLPLILTGILVTPLWGWLIWSFTESWFGIWVSLGATAIGAVTFSRTELVTEIKRVRSTPLPRRLFSRDVKQRLVYGTIFSFMFGGAGAFSVSVEFGLIFGLLTFLMFFVLSRTSLTEWASDNTVDNLGEKILSRQLQAFSPLSRTIYVGAMYASVSFFLIAVTTKLLSNFTALQVLTMSVLLSFLIGLFVGLYAAIQHLVVMALFRFSDPARRPLSEIISHGVRLGFLVNEKIGWDDVVRFYHPSFRQWLADKYFEKRGK